MSESTDDFLQHFGVVGMKWGKHKSGSGGSGSSGGSGTKATEKANRKVLRREVLSTTKTQLLGNKKKKGGMAALAIIGGAPGLSVATGISLARSAGYSKGKSIAVGLIGGAPAGLLVSELSIRKAAKA